ncbi:MAG: hypothetical protein E7316_01350 [Clostridiales bacterium]|nr:hypothetical protein [Clostridiales bacterium]
MKKFLSLLLAAMLLLACTTAMAEDDNATITVNEPVSRYATNNEEDGAEEAQTPSVNTEIWLQVDAAGQIDVTVPLVLVFQTNIDGGYATSPETYKITNNSTADIAVTSLAVAVEAVDSETQPMSFVAFDDVANEEIDAYGLKLHVDATEADAEAHRAAHDAYDKDLKEIEGEADTADVMDGGLFQVYKGEATQVTAEMKTSPLSFTTLRKAGADGAASELDTTMGVKIITITYTVGIDAQNAIGDEITTDDEQFKAPAND